MSTQAIGAATTSAIAAAISAAFAGATGVAAWLTIRGRKPKLKVEASRGTGAGGAFAKSAHGPHLSLRVHNVREFDVQVNQVYFEPKWSWDDPHRWRPNEGNVMPPRTWFAEGSAQVPFTVAGHQTADLGLNAEVVNQFFADKGAVAYRAVIRVVTGGLPHSQWVPVQVSGVPATARFT